MATGVTTEWDDIQVKMGNYLPREHVPCADEIYETNLDSMAGYDSRVAKLKGKQKEVAEEEKGRVVDENDSDFDSDDEDFLKDYRAKRLE